MPQPSMDLGVPKKEKAFNIFNGKCQDWDISYPEFSKLLDSLDEKIISRKQFDKFMDEYHFETEN